MTSNTGLALVGQYIKRLGISNHVNRIEAFRGDDFFKRTLGIGVVSSSPTMRQRMNTNAVSWFGLVDELNEVLLSPKGAGFAVDFGALPYGYMPVDWDTSVTSMPLLFRADSGLCSLKVMREIHTQAQALEREIAFIIKWNPHSTPVEELALEGVEDKSAPVRRNRKHTVIPS